MKTDIEYLTAAKEKIAKNAGFLDWNDLKRTFDNRVPDTWNNQSILLALQKQREDLKAECDHHYKIIEGDEINSLLSIILRKLDQDKLIVLRDALIQRTPELKWKSELKAKIKGSKIATYGQGCGESFNGGLNKALEILNSL